MTSNIVVSSSIRHIRILKEYPSKLLYFNKLQSKVITLFLIYYSSITLNFFMLQRSLSLSLSHTHTHTLGARNTEANSLKYLYTNNWFGVSFAYLYKSKGEKEMSNN